VSRRYVHDASDNKYDILASENERHAATTRIWHHYRARNRSALKMKSATKIFIRIREFAIRRIPGQTLTEYTIILVVVAVASTGIYLALGNNVSSLANGANSSLTNA
jgi:Flp pilus assembly pilin Flp